MVLTLALGLPGTGGLGRACAEDAAPKKISSPVAVRTAGSANTVAENLELAINGSWPSARTIELKLLGTGAGFVVSLPDPPLELEAIMTRVDADIVLDYVLLIGESELCGTLRIPPGELGKPLTVARLYTYQIDMTLSKR